LKTIKIIVTGDGSHSLLNEEMNETYHSRHGAIQESSYVFIENGLNFLRGRNITSTISILEIGFGTGLNAWLTQQWSADKATAVKYHSLEIYPVPEEIWKSLNYSEPERAVSFQKLHLAPWQEWTEMDDLFTLYKDNHSVQVASLPDESYDLVFFDAFAPNKQPEMWELTILEKVTTSLKAGGVFVTYCAKGQLKRDLKALGLDVESLPGPPGKREMVRAVKL